MRLLLLLLSVLPLFSKAQPALPDLTMVFVHDEAGHAQRGAYAATVAEQEWTGTRRRPSWTVELHFTVSSDYPYSQYDVGKHQFWPLTGEAVRDGKRAHLRFSVLDCWCVDQYLLVLQEGAMMRIDLPDAGAERLALKQRILARSGDVASPEVLRFRQGRFSFEALAKDSLYDAMEQAIADRLLAARQRDVEAAPLVAPRMVTAQGAGGLRKVSVDSVGVDKVRLHVTGAVMLDGGCGSEVPMVSVERRTGSGWLVMQPFPFAQMDCGPPWKELADDVIIIAIDPRHDGGGPGLPFKAPPGRYRIVLMGADGSHTRTKAFRMR
jgi:hypothetical protein